jgi:hypothetical protein
MIGADVKEREKAALLRDTGLERTLLKGIYP